MTKRIDHPAFFENHVSAVRLVSLTLLLSIGWLDYVTGYEFGFFIFYFIPVAISAWYCGSKDGLFSAVCSATCWYLSDLYANHPYSNSLFIYWEMFMRLISFLTTAMTLSKIRHLVFKEEWMITELLKTRSQLARYTPFGEQKSERESLPIERLTVNTGSCIKSKKRKL